MKLHFYFAMISFYIAAAVNAQSLPSFKLQPVKSIHIEIGSATYSVISFPVKIEEGRCGIPELKVSKIPGFQNVLGIRASSPFSDTTSLQVITADGNLYDFSVTFANRPTITKFVVKADAKSGLPEAIQPNISNAEKMKWHVDRIGNERPFLNKVVSKFDLACVLEGTYATDDHLFLKLRLFNMTNLSFQPAMLRLYIADRKKAKRTSIQQVEITPDFIQPITLLKGNNNMSWIIAIPKLTIPNKKKFLLEINEENGGRNLQMEIPNRYLLRAKLL